MNVVTFTYTHINVNSSPIKLLWWLCRESNSNLRLRKPAYYPLYYRAISAFKRPLQMYDLELSRNSGSHTNFLKKFIGISHRFNA